jgi:hypothetical protein
VRSVNTPYDPESVATFTVHASFKLTGRGAIVAVNSQRARSAQAISSAGDEAA